MALCRRKIILGPGRIIIVQPALLSSVSQIPPQGNVEDPDEQCEIGKHSESGREGGYVSFTSVDGREGLPARFVTSPHFEADCLFEPISRDDLNLNVDSDSVLNSDF